MAKTNKRRKLYTYPSNTIAIGDHRNTMSCARAIEKAKRLIASLTV